MKKGEEGINELISDVLNLEMSISHFKLKSMISGFEFRLR